MNTIYSYQPHIMPCSSPVINATKQRADKSKNKKIPSKSFPLAAAAIKLALICLRNLFLLSTMSESSPPVNKETYFSVFGKNCNFKYSTFSSGANNNISSKYRCGKWHCWMAYHQHILITKRLAQNSCNCSWKYHSINSIILK